MDRLFSVKNGNRLELQVQYIECVAVQFMNFYLRNRGARIVLLENVLKDPADRLQHRCKSVNRNGRALMVIEGAHIVQAEDMVGVAVRINDGVERRRVGSQHLRSEVGRGVNHNVSGNGGNQDGRPQPFVTGVGGEANRAGATDGWYPGAGPGTKHRDAKAHAFGRLSFTCTKRNRSSISERSSDRCSSSVRLPLVLACSMA